MLVPLSIFIFSALLLLLSGEFIGAALAVLFSIYYVALQCDLQQLLNSLLRSDEKGSSVKNNAHRRIYTTIGRIGAESLERFRYMIHSIETAQTLVRSTKAEVDVDSHKSLKLSQSSGDSYSAPEAIIRAFLKNFITGCHAQSGIVFGVATPPIVEGEQSARLTEVVARLVQNAEDSAVSDLQVVPSIVDHSSEKSIRGDPTLFGIRYSLVATFHTLGGTMSLWLGFTKEWPPHRAYLQILAEALKKLELQLEALAELSSLNRSLQEMHKQDAEKDNFIAHMSHDIRSPLSNIRASISFLEAKGVSGGEIQSVLRNCDLMGDIVEDLLDFSRYKVGKLHAQRTSLLLAPLVQSVAESFSSTVALKALMLHVTIDSSVSVCADQKQLRRIVTNIVGNAIKYTEKGEVRIVATESEKNITLTVQDSGVGISAEHLKGIFTPFSRYHHSVEGVGLGLAVTKILADLNAISIEVDSALNKGSVFSLTLEKGAPPQERTVQRAESAVRRVLLVDDDVEYLDSFGRALERQGFAVLRAGSTAQALTLIDAEIPDAVVADGTLRDGGYQRIYARLQSEETKVLFAVVSGREVEKAGVYENALITFFLKPVSPVVLGEWLRT